MTTKGEDLPSGSAVVVVAAAAVADTNEDTAFVFSETLPSSWSLLASTDVCEVSWFEALPFCLDGLDGDEEGKLMPLLDWLRLRSDASSVAISHPALMLFLS